MSVLNYPEVRTTSAGKLLMDMHDITFQMFFFYFVGGLDIKYVCQLLLLEVNLNKFS
jgi:hypothetical protein